MSTTFGDLKTLVSAAIRDPDGKTFDDTSVGYLVNAGLTEVGRFAPRRFVEDITTVEDAMSYVLLSDDFDAIANEEIEVVNVEVWDASQTPDTLICVVRPASAEYVRGSDVGWVNWGGTLYLPRYVHDLVDGNEGTYVLRVWGYAPYPVLVADVDTCSISNELVEALVVYCQLDALRRLSIERDMFTQWQTRSGNSDVSPAALMNALNIAREEWRQRSRSISRLRSLT